MESNRNLERIKKCPACNREYQGSLVVCTHDSTILMPVKRDELIGTILADKYRIMEEIGRGGMSIVYKGRHELMDRTVAIKMLQSSLLDDQTSIKRFQQEAKAASCLSHTNVISVYDCDVGANGQPYIVMDYLVGESLIDIIKRDNHVDVARALNIFIQACDALEHAHQKGVLHRDLKSSNIMLTQFEGKKDIVKVVDFGIAKLLPSSGKASQNLTQTGEIFGSPIYMSPEQCLGQPLKATSDIYSMGTMLYEALTGEPPLMGDTVVTTMQMHVGTAPPGFAEMRPDLYIPPELERICVTAMQKRPSDRYQSMQEFKEDLEQVKKDLDAAPPPPGRKTSDVKSTSSPRTTVQNLTGQRSQSIPKPVLTDAREVRKPARQPGSTGSEAASRTSYKDLPVQTSSAGMPSRPASAAFTANDEESDGSKKISPLILISIGMVALAVILLLAFMIMHHGH